MTDKQSPDNQIIEINLDSIPQEQCGQITIVIPRKYIKKIEHETTRKKKIKELCNLRAEHYKRIEDINIEINTLLPSNENKLPLELIEDIFEQIGVHGANK